MPLAVANNGVYVSYNSFAHNENFQAKNNPLQNMITLGPNFFNSDDPENTFVCPLLLAKILIGSSLVLNLTRIILVPQPRES